MREFLYSDDMADACVYLMEKIDFKDIINEQLGTNTSCDVTEYKTKEIRNTHINIGTGKDISIKDLAYLIKDIIGYKGEFYFNTSKPDGTMRKVTDVSKLHSLGWRHKMELEDGIKKVYEWYVGRWSQYENLRVRFFKRNSSIDGFTLSLYSKIC
jgi:GDP-L-fucose synthase